MKDKELIISNDQINHESGLGRTRTEMNPDPTLIMEEKAPTIEEEAIFEELGLGKNSRSQEEIVE